MMGNKYIVLMSKEKLASPLDKAQVASIAHRWNAQVFTRVDDARAGASPLVALYGLNRCDDEVERELSRFGAGAVGLVATGPNRNLYIIKIDDSGQAMARYRVGK